MGWACSTSACNPVCITNDCVFVCLDPDYEPLYQYLLGCQQLIQLKLKLEDLQPSDQSSSIQFSEVCTLNIVMAFSLVIFFFVSLCSRH